MGHAASAETRDRRVGIVNETGVTIVRFHGSTTGSDDRQEDFPCRDVLPSGTFAFTGFGGDTGRCRQDLPAIFDDGDGGMQSEVDSCEGGPLTFNCGFAPSALRCGRHKITNTHGDSVAMLRDDP